ncbi:hypothetical protein LLEC1_05572 [Akanthomyces lecanii]|uniref:Dipeptidyl-peptidase V n=1 Tax=Cordyceps confragosa TaxID=2714763 RepID=A0A179ICT3_CORDF|nr:hypothetical protein LLEC1_05572 [Akanthomyces lecanii]
MAKDEPTTSANAASTVVSRGSKDPNDKFDEELADALLSHEYPASYQFSPTADRILYQSETRFGKPKNAVSTIWLATTDAGPARKLTTGRYRDSGPQWHPDGQQIAFLSDRANVGQVTAIWIMSLSGGDAQPVTPLDKKKSIESFKLSPDGRTIAFLCEDEASKDQDKQDDGNDAQVWGEAWDYARLHLVDVESGEVHVISQEERHVTGMSWSPDGDSIAYSSVQSPESGEDGLTGVQISVFDMTTNKDRNVCNVGSEVSALTFVADGKVYFISKYELHLLNGNSAVYYVDTRSLKPKAVRCAFGEKDTPTSIKLAGGKLFVSRVVATRVFISDMDGNNIFEPERPFQYWNVAVDPASQQPVLAASLSDPSTPEEAYIVRRNQDDVKLSNFGEPVLGKVKATPHIFTCRSFDDEEDITGIFIAPSAEKTISQPLPTFVLPHGGPTYCDLPNFDPSLMRWAPYLLSKGCRGIGTFDYEDVIAATDHAVQSGFADPKRLMVGFWSQGGYLSYLCAVRNGLHNLGWRFNAAIAGAGFVDIDGLVLGSDLGATDQRELAGGIAPWETDAADTRARSGSAIWEMKHAVDEARRRGEMVIPPMLILHGEADPRTPYWQAVAFRRALRWYGLPFEFVTFPGAGHFPKVRKHQMDILRRVARWADTYTGMGIE